MRNQFPSLCILLFATCTLAATTDETEAIGQRLDAQLFDAYNACDLASFGALLGVDVEFFHDKGGLMQGRRPVVTAVEKNICGKVRREIIPGTLKSYPMDNYGLVQLGEHRFCAAGTEKCTGIARFVHLWRQSAGTWEVVRIISYDHQPL